MRVEKRLLLQGGEVARVGMPRGRTRLAPVSRAFIVALALAGCRSDERGIALSLRTWAAGDGLVALSSACNVTERALSGEAAGAMGAYTRVLAVSRTGDAAFKARLRIMIRHSVAPDAVRAESYDVEMRGKATRIPRAESTTPHVVPLPTSDGWTIEITAITRCAPSPNGAWGFVEDIFAAA